MDPKTGEKVLMGEKFTDRVGNYYINQILKPYYADVNYASDASDTDQKKLRNKTPDQLIS